jgi:hypothetical protein
LCADRWCRKPQPTWQSRSQLPSVWPYSSSM